MSEEIPINVDPVPIESSPEPIIQDTKPELNVAGSEQINISTDDHTARLRENDARIIEELREKLGVSDKTEKPKFKPKSAEELRGMNFYDRLGLSPNATEDDIKAFRKNMFAYHPDYGGDEEASKYINEAYTTLNNPESRREYDRGINLSSTVASTIPIVGWPGPTPEFSSLFRSSGGRSQENFAPPEEVALVIKLVREKIEELEIRDPKEFIELKNATYRYSYYSHLETTVGAHLDLLKTELEFLEKKNLLTKADLDTSNKILKTDIKFRGRSKAKRFFRGFFRF